MRINQLMLYAIYLCIISSLISCETTVEETNINYNQTSNASFVVQKNENTVKTNQRIQGTWNSSKSGDKYKWFFKGNSLEKSSIYSFGEIGEPQTYNVKYTNGFNGQIDEYGNYIYLIHEGSEKGISYRIKDATKNQVILESKFGDEIKLIK